jgi:hypothetical protein
LKATGGRKLEEIQIPQNRAFVNLKPFADGASVRELAGANHTV